MASLQRLAVLPDLARFDALADALVLVLHLQDVGHGAGQQAGVVGVLHPDLAHHLAHDDLDVLIVDVHALLAVHLQDLLDQVVVHGGGAADPQHVVGVQGAVLQLFALFDDVAVTDLQAGVGHGIGAGVAVVGGDDDVQQTALGGLLEADLAADLRPGWPSSWACGPRTVPPRGEDPG